MRGMRLGAGDDTSFFGGVVANVGRRVEVVGAARILYRVIDFMAQTERGRLMSAACCSQRAVRVPRDGVRVRIEMVVVSTIAHETEMPRVRVFQAVE